jgi:phage terminase large subunit-like protein
MTVGERVIRFIESHLVVPEGDLVGQPVRLMDFQKRFILEVFDNPHVTDTAILSVGRKNTKTATIAFLVVAFLVGPVAVQNSRINSGALSLKQAAEVFNLASKCVNLSPKVRDLIHIVPAGKRMIGKIMNVEYSAVSAEAKTAHGSSPMVAILDEVGQIRGPQSDFVDAITTGQGAYSNPLLIYISTQAASDADFFSILIDDALKNKPLKTVCHVYQADKGCDVLDEAQWAKSNPALGVARSLADMRKQAEKAARMPTFANTFRNLNLNQRVSIFAPFIPVDKWLACLTDSPIPEGLEVFGGLDLSKRTDLTAFTICAQDGANVYAETYFWAPEDGLLDRCDIDRVRYDIWADEGHLILTPGATVDYDFVVNDILRILDGRELVSLAFDPWRMDVFKSALEKAGASIEMTPFIQGFKSMSPALEEVEALFMGNKLKHLRNPVQTMCAANAITTVSPTGFRKLDKSKKTGRMDGMVSMCMAIGNMLSVQKIEKPINITSYINDPIIFKR